MPNTALCLLLAKVFEFTPQSAATEKPHYQCGSSVKRPWAIANSNDQRIEAIMAPLTMAVTLLFAIPLALFPVGPP